MTRACCARYTRLREVLLKLTPVEPTPEQAEAVKQLAEMIESADNDHMEASFRD